MLGDLTVLGCFVPVTVLPDLTYREVGLSQDFGGYN